MQKITFLLALLAVGLIAQAQKPKDFENLKSEYPDDMAVYLQLNQAVKIDLEGDSIAVQVEDYSDIYHLDNRSTSLAKDKVYITSFKELIRLEAKTLVPQGKNKYSELKVTEFLEKDEQSAGIFYDDFKSISFVYPGVEPNVRTTLREVEKMTDPHFFSPFYFGSFLPVLSTKLEITCHKNIKLNYKMFHTDGTDIKFEEKKEGDYNVYTWSAENLKDYDLESGAPAASYFLPHIAYYVGEYITASGEKKKVMDSLDDLYGWYSSLTCNVNKEEDKELRQIVDGLIEEGDSEEEKARKIFYWVQSNIKYVAFEQGMRGFIPHDAGYVYQKRYGDCKDMASITNDMLRMAGIKSYLTWIGSRDIPYSYTELPTPMVDNHMIVTYQRPNGEYLFLDATSSDTYFGLPSAFIQGKEALLSVSPDEYKVAKVPVVSKETNLLADTSYLKLEGNKLTGKARLDLNGYFRVRNLYRLSGKKDEKQEKFLKGFLEKGNNKFFIENYDIFNMDDKDAPLSISYDYRIEDYAKSIGDEIYLNLSLEKPYFNDKIKEDRKLAKKSEFQYLKRDVYQVEIPEGYEVSYLPPASDFKHDEFGYSITYKQEEGKVYQIREIYHDYILLEKDSFDDWNNMVKKLGKAYREAVILKKK